MTRRRMPGRLITAVLLAGLALSGCGRTVPKAQPAPPLPSSAVPTHLSVLTSRVVVKPNRDKQTSQAFRAVGSSSLVQQAGVWELRKGVRLVGTLELATLDTRRVDTAKDKDRTAIRQQILAGDPVEFDVAGLPVWSAKDDDRVVYVWYGRQVLGVLQVKADSLDPEETVQQLVSELTSQRGWPALPLDAFDEQT
jgi:hypothetical protein